MSSRGGSSSISSDLIRQTQRLSLRDEAMIRAASANGKGGGHQPPLGGMATQPAPTKLDAHHVPPAVCVASPPAKNVNKQAVSQKTSEADVARKKWKEHGEDNSQVLENRRAALRDQAASGGGGGSSGTSTTSASPSSSVSMSMPATHADGGASADASFSVYSVRVISAEDRVDPAGSYYTAYLMEVETGPIPPGHRHVVEHRYSEFARLNAELVANNVSLRSSFPTKSLCGRLGNWTPARGWAPDRMAELVTYRKIKLDIWLVELAELLARGDGGAGGPGPGGGGGAGGGLITGDVRAMCMEFFRRSAAGCPPCDRANPVSWDGIKSGGGGSNGNLSETTNGTGQESDEAYNGSTNGATTAGGVVGWKQRSPTRHAGGTEKLISNPVSFTLGSEIRKATYTVMHMCGTSALAGDRSIPLDLLHQAKGLCFLTVFKIGCVVSGRVGTGLIVARTKDGLGWSPPSAVGTVGLGYGALIGGDITSYLIVLTTERAVAAFAGRGSVNLGAELGVAVGPVGRGATGNLNAGEGGIAPAYSYAHSKGFFVGISLEGSVVASRPDVNAKFYGRPVDANMLLFESNQWMPRAALPLYDALDEALDAEIKGFRPSQMGKSGQIASHNGSHAGRTSSPANVVTQRTHVSHAPSGAIVDGASN